MSWIISLHILILLFFSFQLVLGDIFTDAKTSDIKETTLSLLHTKAPVAQNEAVVIPPMEVKSYKLTLSWDRQRLGWNKALWFVHSLVRIGEAFTMMSSLNKMNKKQDWCVVSAIVKAFPIHQSKVQVDILTV